jgi:hypothetical protein
MNVEAMNIVEVEVNDLIHRVAGSMTHGTSAPALRARVLERLPVGRRSPWSSSAWRLSVAAAGVAIVALAAAAPALRDLVTVRTPPVPGHAQRAADALATDHGLAERAALTTPAPTRLHRAARPLSASEVAWLERRVPALDAVEALAMTDIAMKDIGPAPITVPALDLKPLRTEFGSNDDKAPQR